MSFTGKKMFDIALEDQGNSTMVAVHDHNSLFCLSNLIKFAFLLFFAVTILTFPGDIIK
jgi:hypothetical protein